MNPVPLMPLVEVIRGHATSDATTRTVMDTARALGKTPVEVNDYPGFVSNRVLMPMINEAIFCVMEGVAQPDAIDTVMKLGMAHPMGPLALADFIGLDVCLAILEVNEASVELREFAGQAVLLLRDADRQIFDDAARPRRQPERWRLRPSDRRDPRSERLHTRQGIFVAARQATARSHSVRTRQVIQAALAAAREIFFLSPSEPPGD